MIRRSTVFWLVLAAFCGSALFYTSQQVTDGRDRLSRLEQDISREDESLRVLQAEWSYLNQPDRLEKLARTFLNQEPMTGRQFAKLTDIAPRSASSEQPVSEMKIADKAEAAPLLKEVPTVVRIVKPPVAARAAAKPATVAKKTVPSPQESKRDFGDVMKSLGVN